MHSHRYTAFTLVELLVVISIVAFLISILMPALSRARWQAKVVACASQARQIHIGLTAYATDANGHYMPATSVTNLGLEFITLYATLNGGQAHDTREGLLQYIVSPETFYCPDGSVASDEVFKPGLGSWRTNEGALWITYAILAGAGDYNLPQGLTLDRPQTRLLGDAAWFDDGILWVKQEQDVVQPSRAPFLADLMMSDSRVQPGKPGVFRHNHSGYITPLSSPVNAHVDQSEGFMGGNSVFFDGHSEWKQQKAMSEVLGPDNDDHVVSLGHLYYAF